MSLPLFDTPAVQLPPRRTVNALRDASMARVGQKAEDTRQGFTDQARQFVLRYLESHGPTSGEVLTLACKAAGIRAQDDRAMGPVFYTLAKRGLIVKVGTCRRERGHGCGGANIWSLKR